MKKDAKTIAVSVVSAEDSIYDGEGELIVVSADKGELGIKPGHAPLLASLKPGQVRVVNDDSEEVFYISGGFLEVQPNQVTVLADTAQRASNIDEAGALEAQARAEKMLSDKQDNIDYEAARKELARAAALLATLRRSRRERG